MAINKRSRETEESVSLLQFFNGKMLQHRKSFRYSEEAPDRQSSFVSLSSSGKQTRRGAQTQRQQSVSETGEERKAFLFPRTRRHTHTNTQLK